MTELNELKSNGKTILLSTHNMQSVQDTCSHILLLNKGEKLADSSFSELQKKYQSKKFIVRYRGTKIAFANALWTDFELINQEEIEEGLFEAILIQRGERRTSVVASLLLCIFEYPNTGVSCLFLWPINVKPSECTSQPHQTTSHRCNSDIHVTVNVTEHVLSNGCLLYTSPSPRDISGSRMPSSA